MELRSGKILGEKKNANVENDDATKSKATCLGELVIKNEALLYPSDADEMFNPIAFHNKIKDNYCCSMQQEQKFIGAIKYYLDIIAVNQVEKIMRAIYIYSIINLNYSMICHKKRFTKFRMESFNKAKKLMIEILEMNFMANFKRTKNGNQIIGYLDNLLSTHIELYECHYPL
jgi:hypothetical protein